jgi:hypothetical protein
MVDEEALGQVFSEYFGFLDKRSTDCSTLITNYYPTLVQ